MRLRILAASTVFWLILQNDKRYDKCRTRSIYLITTSTVFLLILRRTTNDTRANATTNLSCKYSILVDITIRRTLKQYNGRRTIRGRKRLRILAASTVFWLILRYNEHRTRSIYLITTTTTTTMISTRRRTRSKSNKNQMRAEREDDTVRKYLPRFTRLNYKPRCLNYAPSREDFKELFPEYLFCCKCVTVSNDFAISTNKNMDINSENYKCVANHTDFSYPTTLKPPPWWSSRKLRGNYVIDKKKKARIETAPASATKTTTTTTTTALDLMVQRPLFGPSPPPPPPVGIPVIKYEFLNKQLLVDITSEHDTIQQKLLPVQQESDSISQVIVKQQEQILRADTTIETKNRKTRSLIAKLHCASCHNRTIKRLVDESPKKNFYISPNDLSTRAVNSFASPNQLDSVNFSVCRDSVSKFAARCKLYVENMLLQEQSLFDNHLRVG
jgi:hypothetical protein